MERRSHGKMDRRLNDVYWNMRKRCYDKRSEYYALYGGRGIKVCAEWMTGFAPFRDWAYANGYKSGLTIDRIDNDGNYEPSNCRWTTMKEQINNRSISLNYTLDGETKSLKEWCDKFGIPYERTRWRVKRWGFSRRCFDTKFRSCAVSKVVACFSDGRKRTFASISEAARFLGVTDVAVGNSIRRHSKCCGATFTKEKRQCLH